MRALLATGGDVNGAIEYIPGWRRYLINSVSIQCKAICTMKVKSVTASSGEIWCIELDELPLVEIQLVQCHRLR